VIFGLLPASPDTPEEYAAAPGEWIWPVLFARRPDTLVEFYRDVLGHDVHPEHRTPLFSGDFVLADGPRARAGAMALPAGTTGRPAWLGLIRVTDLDATVQAATRHGGEVLRPPTEDLIGGRVAVVSDPAGAVFGLVQLAAATGPHASGPSRVTRLRP
jgi:predicted enzyme related to lactoylglutathione lyase